MEHNHNRKNHTCNSSRVMGIFLSSFNKSRAPACQERKTNKKKKVKRVVNVVAIRYFKYSINTMLLSAFKVSDWIKTIISSQFIPRTTPECSVSQTLSINRSIHSKTKVVLPHIIEMPVETFCQLLLVMRAKRPI